MVNNQVIDRLKLAVYFHFTFLIRWGSILC